MFLRDRGMATSRTTPYNPRAQYQAKNFLTSTEDQCMALLFRLGYRLQAPSHSINPPGDETAPPELFSEIPENVLQYITDQQRVRPYNLRNHEA
ncbi:hypothetical protein X801_00477 [Opisthorchis viverrini]|uniref:Uncharacterized protein n=1 Tax=Opisthorchis viverrini TaxID=6198 RepID=A0A1S8XAY5_OPIVI|nr:hypothetical protein X801_00477 [Opisthorchis viverrini]